MTLVDLYRNVYRLHTVKQFTSSELAFLFVLIGEWNEQRRPEYLQTSRQALQELSSIPMTTLRRIIQRLCSFRIIETRHSRGKLEIKIRPQADWHIAGWNAADERQKDEPKSAIRCAQIRPIESREETRADMEDDEPVSLAQLLNERRRLTGKS